MPPIDERASGKDGCEFRIPFGLLRYTCPKPEEATSSVSTSMLEGTKKPTRTIGQTIKLSERVDC